MINQSRAVSRPGEWTISSRARPQYAEMKHATMMFNPGCCFWLNLSEESFEWVWRFTTDGK